MKRLRLLVLMLLLSFSNTYAVRLSGRTYVYDDSVKHVVLVFGDSSCTAMQRYKLSDIAKDYREIYWEAGYQVYLGIDYQYHIAMVVDSSYIDIPKELPLTELIKIIDSTTLHIDRISVENQSGWIINPTVADFVFKNRNFSKLWVIQERRFCLLRKCRKKSNSSLHSICTR